MRDSRRQRTISIVVGVVIGLVAAALLAWLVVHIIDEENTRSPQAPAVPTDTFKTDLLTPSTPPQTNGTQPTGGATNTPTQSNHKPTDNKPSSKATATRGNR
ncbi:MAG TPA: hypothetical protein VH419_01795 [Nocardioidaceae bacterium]